MRRDYACFVAGMLAVVLVVGGCDKGPQPGEQLDEALSVGRTADTLAGADEDYMRDMDYGVTKDPVALAATLDPYWPGITPEEAVRRVAIGRNNWNVWTAGNDRFWDQISRDSFGALDLVKTLSNHPSLSYSRDNRWYYLGLVNEPCFSKGTGPRADRYGLWLDVRDPDCPPDPFENEDKYPGVQIGARGQNIPVGSYYGYATGILGLRLFPNPDFDEAAEAAWDAERYYTDPDYYNRADLVKPYRVGMSCGFCHIGPNPSNPPPDPENPTYAQLNSNPGAQYFWIDRIFFWDQDDSNFVLQLFHTSRPGALDTSLVSSDNINNPRTMNAVYSLGARAAIAAKWGKEKLAGGGLNNKVFQDYSPPLPDTSPLMTFYKDPDVVWTPRVLKDGADSVGVLGALNRVFINIGLFSEEWTLHFKPLVGGPDITPIEIAVLGENSAYWQSTEAQTIDTALFFLATAGPDKLSVALESTGLAAAGEEGSLLLTGEDAKVARGKQVYAERCARCHSSKLPEKAFTDFFPDNGCVNENYLSCWNDYWQWTKTDEFKTAMLEEVNKEDFLEDNFLSTELRIPVTLLETNACSPVATNAIAGDIWDNFSSESYKNLPAVGSVQIHHPYTGELRDEEWELPGGGRGYTRPASLISLWSTAPYLLSNSLGKFYWSGSVEDRMASFEDSITKLLWPQKRSGNLEIETRSGKKHPGWVDGTTETSYLRVATGYLPGFLQPLVGPLHRWLPWLFGEGGVEIGPIPKGTPVNLLANIDISKESDKVALLKLLLTIKRDLKALPENATDEQAKEIFGNLLDPLLAVNKCPDFVVNRGHYFGTDYLPASEGEPGLSDEDKWALIEWLKHL